MKKIIAFIAVATLATTGGVLLGHRQTAPSAPAATASHVLFTSSMNDLNGTPQSMSQWKGKKLVVNFWATWCAPCVEEMPELSALQTEIAANQGQIIGIGIDSPANMTEFAGKHNISYPLYVGGLSGTELSRQLGNQAGGLPFTVLFGPDGEVKKTYLGRLKIDQLKQDIANL